MHSHRTVAESRTCKVCALSNIEYWKGRGEHPANIVTRMSGCWCRFCMVRDMNNLNRAKDCVHKKWSRIQKATPQGIVRLMALNISDPNLSDEELVDAWYKAMKKASQEERKKRPYHSITSPVVRAMPLPSLPAFPCHPPLHAVPAVPTDPPLCFLDTMETDVINSFVRFGTANKRCIREDCVCNSFL